MDQKLYKSFLIIALISMFVISGCVIEDKILEEQDYKILSISDFDEGVCTSTGSSGPAQGGYNFGLRFKAVDFDTGTDIGSSRGLLSIESASSLSPDFITCHKHLDSGSGNVEIYAKGYTPKKFKIEPLPMNKIIEIEVVLKRSCTEKIYDTENEEYFFELIEDKFGLINGKYELKCMEFENGRGGFIKATGEHESGSEFELYYRQGWCSSGGQDCYDTICFDSENEDFVNSVNRYIEERKLYIHGVTNTNCLSY